MPDPKPANDPRYKYEDIRPPSVPVEILDNLAKSIFDPAAAQLSWLGVIFTGLKLAFAVAYLWAREKLLVQQAEFKKQVYEREQAGKNQNDLEKDPMGGERRP